MMFATSAHKSMEKVAEHDTKKPVHGRSGDTVYGNRRTAFGRRAEPVPAQKKAVPPGKGVRFPARKGKVD